MVQKFKFEALAIEGAYLICPFCATDHRGGFIKDYNVDVFKDNGVPHDLKEIFYTVSKKGVIRAIHFQNIRQQAKLVRCIKGCIYDVIVDLRKGSPTFGHWLGFELSEKNMLSLFIPEYFGHGYIVLEDSIVSYKCNEVFYAEGDSGIIWNDPDINIIWPLSRIGGEKNLIISDKDTKLQSFNDYSNEACI